MPMCVGVNGQPCPGEKNGKLLIEICGEVRLLCRVCYSEVRPKLPADDNHVGNLSEDSLTVTSGGPLSLDDTAINTPVADTPGDKVAQQLVEMIESADEGQNGMEAGSLYTGMSSSRWMVLNELLCLCVNMLDGMAQSLLQYICVEFYSDAAIGAARE